MKKGKRERESELNGKTDVVEHVDDETEVGALSAKKVHLSIPSSNSTTRTAPTASLNRATTLVKSAMSDVQKQETNSSTFKGLFHKSGETKMSNNDLFTCVAGHRYTLG